MNKKEKQTKKEMTAIDTVLNWTYNPSVIEDRVDERDFSKHEKEILATHKF